MAGDWTRIETALRSSLRLFFRGNRKEASEAEQPSALEALPINVQLYIMSFLTPKDLSYLGSTSCYWRLAVQDPLLWRHFLIRDVSSWTAMDWTSLPEAKILDRSFPTFHNDASYDYMAAYRKCHSCCKQSWSSRQTTHGTMASFFQSLITQAEPRFAMFGPGLEDLSESLMHNMMGTPEILPLAGIPARQIHGIGSGIKFHLNNQKFNILTLYSRISKERCRPKEEDTTPINKIFHTENNTDGTTQYTLIDHVKNMCGLIDGFIYVADAEVHKKHNRPTEFAQMLAMLDPALGPPNRPLLVLSCVSDAEMKRIPCVYVAHQLQLNLLSQPWLIQDTEAASLAGLLDGLHWLLKQTEHRNTQ